MIADPIDTAGVEQLRTMLWWFGDRVCGIEPGHFEQALYSAIGRADVPNRERLALGFPSSVALYRTLQTDQDAIDRARLRVLDWEQAS